MTRTGRVLIRSSHGVFRYARRTFELHEDLPPAKRGSSTTHCRVKSEASSVEDRHAPDEYGQRGAGAFGDEESARPAAAVFSCGRGPQELRWESLAI